MNPIVLQLSKGKGYAPTPWGGFGSFGVWAFPTEDPLVARARESDVAFEIQFGPPPIFIVELATESDSAFDVLLTQPLEKVGWGIPIGIS